MFIGESIMVGLVGGLVGVGLSYILTPFFIQRGAFFSVEPVLGMETVILSVIFTVLLTLLSVFRPARRASKLEVMDALQEYRFVEEVKPYKSRWAWIAFFLGSYKIALWLLGINLAIMMSGPLPASNILIMILLGSWVIFDVFVLNYVGAILFFWGFMKLLIRGSLKFQEFVAKLVKFAGDLNVLSTKNVRRNPARTAAIAFLIAMIVGYSFQVIGLYASENDYTIRHVRFTVGSDISVRLATLQNLTSTIDRIGNISDISSLTVEYKFWKSAYVGPMTFIAVEPKAWLDIAYFEDSLFTGNDVVSAFQEMENDNHTIILERRIAESLKFKIGDLIPVQFTSEVFKLKVVGFFGPSASTQYLSAQPIAYYWSYVPVGFYEEVKNEIVPNTKILVKLTDGGDGKTVAEDIRDLKIFEISTVYSVVEVLEWLEENPLGTSTPTPFLGLTGPSEIQRLGVAFAVIAASLGVALITLVSLRERSKEVGIMSVRGLSLKQIVGVLLTENLAVVGFAVFLGAVVGLIVIQGNISIANSMPTNISSSTSISSFSPIQRRMIFPLNTIITLTVCCLLVFSSTIMPVIITVKKYISHIERIVREA
jgi:ABC-type lipoprotein release transport system permease subunit